MRQSQLFTKTRKEAPADETSKNAQFLIRAGFINKEMAGVYTLLPLGFSVVNKIKKIVNEEMNALGSQEILMSTIQPKEVWEVTDRWDSEKVDVWFKSILKNGTEIGFGWSHEEPITNMLKSHISSYVDLPVYVHQFQTKLRNEERAKSGVMRGREFVMKDMYSYARDEKEHMDFYNKTIDSYKRVFDRLGLGNATYVTTASGGVFSDKFSHEFQTICEAGEDNIYVHKDGKMALNEEVFNDKTLLDLGVSKEDFEFKKAAEIGNIFTFGTKKCEEIGLYFTDKDGNKKPVYLGSYGIGITRVMGVIAEVFSDNKGLVWPKEVSPFNVHLVRLGNSDASLAFADRLYTELESKGVEVLYDDRDLRPGEKFADSDLIGIPVRFVVSDKTVAENKIEVKYRTSAEAELLSETDALKIL
ncbi:MAG: prolyl-tRNA synthetase [Parcubacteria bacterium C7867-006]|nr:MAG: prolyl-tRNA synthetase [Parcubacteria bacterium C7867-006]